MTNTTTIQNRLKSKVFWMGIVSIILLVGGNYGLWDAIGMTSDTFQAIANGILSILTAIGVFNNPSDSESI